MGVCLGAQLIARALGPTSRPPAATRSGTRRRCSTDEGCASVLTLGGAPSAALARGPVRDPGGGDATGRDTPASPNQAFAVGDTVLAQFHLEADHTRIESWLVGHAHELAAAGIDPQRLRTDAAASGPGLARAATRVIDAWLDRLAD